MYCAKWLHKTLSIEQESMISLLVHTLGAANKKTMNKIMKRFIKNLAMLEMNTFSAITLSSFMPKLQVFWKIYIQGLIQLSTQGWPLPWGS